VGEKRPGSAKTRNRLTTAARATAGRVNGIAFDAGGLIALERNDRRVFAILDTALKDRDRIVVPATALAQVIRNPATQLRLWRMIQSEGTEVIPLDGLHAQAVGALLARTGASDIADAHVVICAQEAGYAVITSDPLDLKRLDPKLRVISV
jgi:predicted nucleic acid-binding protein